MVMELIILPTAINIQVYIGMENRGEEANIYGCPVLFMKVSLKMDINKVKEDGRNDKP